MPIKFVKGDIFQSNAKVLVNPVNCVGVMGAGLAKEFKKRYPGHYSFYKKLCDEGSLKKGSLGGTPESDGKMVTFVTTKLHWKDSSTLEHIEAALKSLQNFIITHKWPSMAVPALGCGLGGLPWKDVKQLIESTLNNLDCDISVYKPGV